MSRPNARQTALSALRSWENGSRHADEILADLSRKNRLQGPEHALAQSLFYGVLRHLTRLDALIDDLRRGHLNPELRCVLRLGLFQLFHTGIAEHAAVNETVALARGLRGVVNGILRNAQRRREELAALADTWPPAVRFSHPDFLIERWERQFGPEATEKLCRWNNEPPAVFARTNRLREGAEEALQTASEAARVPGKAGFFRLAEGAPPAAWIDEGLVYIQDPSTVLACNLLHPKRGERVLDACAAPGGKTALMADRMKNGGRIVAADSSPDRLGLLRENLRRLGVENTESIVVDWLRPKKNFLASLPKFDAILVDVPCSNTGVIRRRIDVRWRLRSDEFSHLQRRQLTIADACVPLLKPGGRLVYSTCSLEPDENLAVVELLMERHPGLFALEETVESLPWRDGFDGAFAARLKMKG